MPPPEKEQQPYIVVTLNLKDAVEISDFAALFAGLGSQFDDFLKHKHPDLEGTAEMYVREVRSGSIIADLVPAIGSVIAIMDQAIIVSEFARRVGGRILTLASGKFLEGARKSDLQHVSETIRAVANDNGGTASIESITYSEDGPVRKLEAEFATHEARRALATIESQKTMLDKKENADHEKALMYFTRADTHDAKIDKRSGERIKIEKISDRDLALVYQSELAKERIKSEIHGSISVFRKGFIVDVNVLTKNGRPVAYAIVHVHDVFDLPEQ